MKAKCVINATGPHTDFVRVLDDPQQPKICCPSSGVHVVLPNYYSPANMGLLDPATSDGRVIFFLPWQKSTMAGELLNVTLTEQQHDRRHIGCVDSLQFINLKFITTSVSHDAPKLWIDLPLENPNCCYTIKFQKVT